MIELPLTGGLYVHNKHPRKICAYWMMWVCHMVAKTLRYVSLANLRVGLLVKYLSNSLEDPTHRSGCPQVILAPLVMHHLSVVRHQPRKVPTVSGVLWNVAMLHGSCHMHDHPLDMRKHAQICKHPQENTFLIGNACKADAFHP